MKRQNLTVTSDGSEGRVSATMAQLVSQTIITSPNVSNQLIFQVFAQFMATKAPVKRCDPSFDRLPA